DVLSRNVDLINRGEAPVIEPGLSELIAANRRHLRATSDYRTATHESDASFIIVPTPSDEKGGFSLRYVKAAIREIGRALKGKKTYHLVVVTSTVLPGSTQFGLLPLLEQESGKRCGEAFGLCYNPEFIALGSVIHDLLNPDFILIGESDRRAGQELEDLYKVFCDNHPPVKRMNFVNAELTKIAVNTFVTTKITFANMLAGICEELPGGNIDTVSEALGMDTRIGSRYLRSATAGPAFQETTKRSASWRTCSARRPRLRRRPTA
ncbi:MAG: UDP-glucose/GDP-mannose dehydrogenase family protein, partial [Nitrospiraceae bacterium]